MRASLHVTLALALAVMVVPTSALSAQPKTGAKHVKYRERAATEARFEKAIRKIQSGEPVRMREGLDVVRAEGSRAAAAAPLVIGALGAGLSFDLSLLAIEALGELEVESGSVVLAEYATHRDVKLRRAAMKSLARTKGSVAVAALRRGLSDADAMVRNLSASGLGAFDAKDANVAVPELFLALDRGIHGAAVPIGHLCFFVQCNELLDRLGKLPFDAVAEGLEQVLLRPASEIGDDLKVKVIDRVRALGTVESGEFLRRVTPGGAH